MLSVAERLGFTCLYAGKEPVLCPLVEILAVLFKQSHHITLTIVTGTSQFDIGQLS